jgi:hypothetical protein
MRTAGIVVTSVGAAVAISGVVMLAMGQDPKRYDEKKVDLAASARSWQPVFTVGTAGGGVGLAGRF